MSIPNVRDFFGIKYLILYNITTKVPFCVLRAIGEVNFDNAQEAVTLNGGHTEAPYDVEYGQPDPTLTCTVREYPAELFKAFEKYTITENSAETGGALDASPTNGQGTSVINATNGIATVAITTAADLIFGRYILKATAAQELDLYVAGLEDSFEDIEGKVNSTSIETTTAGTVAIANTGISLTVVGTPNYTIGDTAYVDIRPINTGSTKVVVGAGTTPSNFGVRCVFPRKTDGVLHYIDLFNVSGRGMPWRGVSREFSEFEINLKPLARSSDGAVYEMVRVLGS
jgi:hypothetical protein